jgi:hypothetical protein
VFSEIGLPGDRRLGKHNRPAPVSIFISSVAAIEEVKKLAPRADVYWPESTYRKWALDKEPAKNGDACFRTWAASIIKIAAARALKIYSARFSSGLCLILARGRVRSHVSISSRYQATLLLPRLMGNGNCPSLIHL